MIVKEVVRAGKGDVHACMWLDVDLSFSSHKSVEDEMLPIPPAWTFIFANQNLKDLLGLQPPKLMLFFSKTQCVLTFRCFKSVFRYPMKNTTAIHTFTFQCPVTVLGSRSGGNTMETRASRRASVIARWHKKRHREAFTPIWHISSKIGAQEQNNSDWSSME